MIAAGLVEEVRRLLEQGELSQRKIAVRLGVSRGTVNAIALGKRAVRVRRKIPVDDFLPPAGPVGRCPTCGGLVRMPCLACRVRAGQRRRPIEPAARHVAQSRTGRPESIGW